MKNSWLERIIADPETAVRGEILEEFRKTNPAPPWPTKHAGRTIAELETSAKEIEQQMKLKTAAQAARKRQKMLAEMADNPSKYLAQTEKLVTERSTDAYRRLAILLADLREALAGTDREILAQKHAQELRKRHPTRNHLISELRKQGF